MNELIDLPREVITYLLEKFDVVNANQEPGDPLLLALHDFDDSDRRIIACYMWKYSPTSKKHLSTREIVGNSLLPSDLETILKLDFEDIDDADVDLLKLIQHGLCEGMWHYYEPLIEKVLPEIPTIFFKDTNMCLDDLRDWRRSSHSQTRYDGDSL